MSADEKSGQPANAPEKKQAGGPEPAMGMEMMKKMMGQMGQGGESPMAMMQKMMAQMSQSKGAAEGAPPMQSMMGMCAGMLATMQQTTALATFATPELRQLFSEWLVNLENEALKTLRDSDGTDVAGLAQALRISEEGAIYLIAHMAKAGKISLSVQAAAD